MAGHYCRKPGVGRSGCEAKGQKFDADGCAVLDHLAARIPHLAGLETAATGWPGRLLPLINVRSDRLARLSRRLFSGHQRS